MLSRAYSTPFTLLGFVSLGWGASALIVDIVHWFRYAEWNPYTLELGFARLPVFTLLFISPLFYLADFWLAGVLERESDARMTRGDTQSTSSHESLRRIRKGFHRLGIVLGVIASIVCFFWIGNVGPDQVWLLLIFLLVAFLLMYLVVRLVGWTVEGFKGYSSN